MKLICMRGLSSSGKSTKAREIADTNGAAVVNRDALRQMILGQAWTGKAEDEDRVTIAEEAQVNALLKAGVPVVIDSTHIEPRFLRKWAKLATGMAIPFEVVDVKVDVEECVLRDKERQARGERFVGEAVIRKQAKRMKWPVITAEPFVIEPVEWIDGLPEAVIFDIDGTLAHIPEGGRSPFDYSRVNEDIADESVRWLHNLIDNRDTLEPGVFIISGRDDTCRPETEEWLRFHGIGYDALFMRPVEMVDQCGNKAPDYQVKYALFNQHFRGQYNVRAIFDDRQQVVDMWRKLGLKCLQVAPGDF